MCIITSFMESPFLIRTGSITSFNDRLALALIAIVNRWPGRSRRKTMQRSRTISLDSTSEASQLILTDYNNTAQSNKFDWHHRGYTARFYALMSSCGRLGRTYSYRKEKQTSVIKFILILQLLWRITGWFIEKWNICIFLYWWLRKFTGFYIISHNKIKLLNFWLMLQNGIFVHCFRVLTPPFNVCKRLLNNMAEVLQRSGNEGILKL